MLPFINILKNKKLQQEFKSSVPEKSSFSELKSTFLHSIELNTNGVNKAAILFSAGVDSSLIAKAVAQKIKKTVLYTVGLQQSKDIKAAEEGAEQFGIPLVKRIVSREEIPKYLEQTREVIKNDDCLQLQIALPEFIVAEKIKEDNHKVVFSGQGSDELFCGYDSYKRVLREGGYNAVQALIWQKLENLYEHDLYREVTIAKHFNLELKIPFLDELFVEKAVAYPVEEKILSTEDNLRKHPLRRMAKEFSLPKSIYTRPKKAIQFGSGLAKEIEKVLGKNYIKGHK